MSELELCHTHLPDPSGQSAVKMCIIGLVAINKDGKWCATHETRGWYMPAGRVDYGEGIDTGAKREALEEGGVDVRLTNILRLDFTPTAAMVRFRAIFNSELINPDQQLRGKDKADHEIIEAVWVNPEELEDGRKLRSDEMIEIFKYLNKRPPLIPASFLSCTDGYPIDHKIVITKTYFSMTVIVFNNKQKSQVLTIKSGKKHHDFPNYFMPKPTTFSKGVRSAFPDITIIGFSKLRFIAPDSRIPEREFAHMNVVAVGIAAPVSKDQKFRNISKIKLNNWNKVLLQEVLDKKIAPESIFDFEGAELKNLGADIAKIDEFY